MRSRLSSVLTAIRCLVSVAFVTLASVTAILGPLLWLLVSQRMTTDDAALMRYMIALNSISLWCYTVPSSISSFLILRRKLPLVREWLVELPQERHALARDLIEFIESSPSWGLGERGRVRVYLSFAAIVAFRKDPKRRGGWQLVLGLPAIALLSVEEVKALAWQQCMEQMNPPTPLHPWLCRLANRAAFWQTSLPPHPGMSFSLTHQFVEILVKAARPAIGEQLKKGIASAVKRVPLKVMVCAISKTQITPATLPRYMAFYQSAINLGAMPPIAEGFYRIGSKGRPAENAPCFREIENLWVYERKLVKAVLGDRGARELRLVSWDDFSEELLSNAWRLNAAALKPSLSGRHASDLPSLVSGWHVLARRTLGKSIRSMTPDVQKKKMVQCLASVFATVLMGAGWELKSSLGEEFRLGKNQTEFQPFRLLNDLASGKLPGPEFIRRCQEASAADLPLS